MERRCTPVVELTHVYCCLTKSVLRTGKNVKEDSIFGLRSSPNMETQKRKKKKKNKTKDDLKKYKTLRIYKVLTRVHGEKFK